MSFKEVGKLRKEGKLEEALILAQQDLDTDDTNIWSKRAIAWVYFEYLKANTSTAKVDTFLSFLEQLKELKLPAEEEMIFESMAWKVGALVFDLVKTGNQSKTNKVFDLIKDFSFPKPKDSYSFLFKAFHKAYKGTDKYVNFADWWDFANFNGEDFLSQEYNGTKQMSIVEQAYIAYAKAILEGGCNELSPFNRVVDKEKIKGFLPKLDKIIDNYPAYQYPPFYKAKILLATGDKDDVLAAFIPFATRKKNDFWVWDLLADAFPDGDERIMACLCKAVSLKSPEKFLGKVRIKLAKLLIDKELFPEAKYEINSVIKTRKKNEWKISSDLKNWTEQAWFESASIKSNNADFYRKHIPKAEAILYSGIAEEVVVVEFVNENKFMLNFIKDKSKHGFFKYDRLLTRPKVGDVLQVRFGDNSTSGFYKVYTAKVIEGAESEAKRTFSGVVSTILPSNVGFVDNVFLSPLLVKKHKLFLHDKVTGVAILSYNKKREEWGWKAIEVSVIPSHR